MIRIDRTRTPRDLLPKIARLFELSGAKILAIEETWRPQDGAPVFTVQGRYQARGWTEWTQGFQFGSALLQFDATGDARFLEIGRSRTVERMAAHLTHMGVHDHGFNNVSTYGNLWRLAREGRIDATDWERRFYELALKASGAVQARRWTTIADGGFIYSFNGAHSLFVDTIRSLRVAGARPRPRSTTDRGTGRSVSLLERLVQHARATADVQRLFRPRPRSLRRARAGRAREPLQRRQRHLSRPEHATGLLAVHAPGRADWRGRCSASPSSSNSSRRCQTRRARRAAAGRRSTRMLLDAARATCDHYLDVAAADGVPYWDAGAPGLAALDGWRDRPANPFNPLEPVDSSAAAIAAQGLLRLARVLERRGSDADARPLPPGWTPRPRHAVRRAVPERATRTHQGLVLHSVYHWPNGWDYVPPGATTPRGESSQWGDYHAREAALYVKRLAEGAPYLTFFGPENHGEDGANGMTTETRSNGDAQRARSRVRRASRRGAARTDRIVKTSTPRDLRVFVFAIRSARASRPAPQADPSNPAHPFSLRSSVALWFCRSPRVLRSLQHP